MTAAFQRPETKPRPPEGRLALARDDFYWIKACSIVNHGNTVRSLAKQMPMSSSKTWFGFRTNPLFGELAGMSFFNRPIQAKRAWLAIADWNQVHGLNFEEQQVLLPAGFRPASTIEAVATIMAYHQQTGGYPDLGMVWFWTDDIIKLEEWPRWYRQFRGIEKDCRVVLRIDPVYGLIISYFAFAAYKSWVDWVTPDSESYRNIVMAATLD